MSRRALAVLGFAAAAFAGAGCTARPAEIVAVATVDSPARAAKYTRDVALFVGTEPARPYVMLGVVAVQSHRGDDPFALLSAAGSRLGADAVVRVRQSRGSGFVVTRGVAVAFTDTRAPHEVE